MQAQQFMQKTLREKLDELKLVDVRFSLRAFAKLLDISPASLSEFLNGKRVLSDKTLNKLLSRLDLTPTVRTQFELLRAQDKDQKIDNKELSKLRIKAQIAEDQYFLISDWHYYALLCLVETKDFKKDYRWIANRLNSSEKKVKECFERLLRLGYLEYTSQGEVIYKDIELVTSEDIPNTSIKKRHIESLKSAEKSLLTDHVEQRDFSSMTLAIDSRKLDIVKKKIRAFQDELADYLEADSKEYKDEVYEFCFQFFPRSNVIKGEG